MKFLMTSSGHTIIVDNEDYADISQYHWYIRIRKRYGADIYRRLSRKEGRKKIVIHRHILGLSTNDPNVDHVNGNRFDNRRSNLRLATQAENSWNRHICNSASGFYGVYPAHKSRKWIATIMKHGRISYLGSFNSKKQAAIRRDTATIALHQNFGTLNFPELIYWSAF